MRVLTHGEHGTMIASMVIFACGFLYCIMLTLVVRLRVLAHWQVPVDARGRNERSLGVRQRSRMGAPLQLPRLYGGR
jgi:hypothetical protein